ncbi:gliadoralin-A-like [Grammomys surdaster]|uniref:gliadoralin-A-like n=1 Tax=Grammomys surdaster TaxID=491861 RepID=UPI00109F90B3|nr:gliadoralin-A-like [Grammomys surdaster]
MLVVLLTLVVLVLSSAQKSNREFVVSSQRERLPSYQQVLVPWKKQEYQSQQDQWSQQRIQQSQQERQYLKERKQKAEKLLAQRPQQVPLEQ